MREMRKPAKAGFTFCVEALPFKGRVGWGWCSRGSTWMTGFAVEKRLPLSRE
jgi:hypothetical protein